MKKDMSHDSDKVTLGQIHEQDSLTANEALYVENRSVSATQGKIHDLLLTPQAVIQMQALVGNQSTLRLTRQKNSDKTVQRKNSRPFSWLRTAQRETGASATQSASLQREADTTELPDKLKTGIESLSGYSLDDVNVHYNSDKPAQLNAHAYAQGQDIFVAPGQEKHLPHEAWHVVQQKQGRAEPTAQLKGEYINNQPSLETEADMMGAKAANMPNLSTGYTPPLKISSSAPLKVIQGMWSMRVNLNFEAMQFIYNLTSQGDYVNAFKIFASSEGLDEEFEQILAFVDDNEDARDILENILIEAWDDPDNNYIIPDIIFEIKNNPTIAEVINEQEKELGMDEMDEDLDTESSNTENLFEMGDEEDVEMENLIAQFQKLYISVPFKSDVDDEDHEVLYNSSEHNDIIVKSNPKPLKEVITNGTWQNIPIPIGLQNSLTDERKKAKLALYRIAGKKNRNIKGARNNKNMNAFKKILAKIADIFAKLRGKTHYVHLQVPTDLTNSVNHGNDSRPTEGKHVIARPLSINSSTAGSKPHDGRLMASIRNLAGPERKSYVQMHLLNDLIFGPGQLWNLTPGPKQSNVDMERAVEDPLKRAVLGKGLVINFEAQVNYANDPTTASDTDIQQNPDKYRFQSITFRAKQLEYDDKKKLWRRAPTQDVDVQKVDNAVINWRYGSLTPLTPKPRLFDPSLTVKQLTDVGVPNAAAVRIVDFLQANPSWRPPKSVKKQQQLAFAVKAWDGSRTLPNVRDWKATAVLWT